MSEDLIQARMDAVEEELMNSLSPEQLSTLTEWMKLYGDCYDKSYSAYCWENVRDSWAYAAHRLEALAKQGGQS